MKKFYITLALVLIATSMLAITANAQHPVGIPAAGPLEYVEQPFDVLHYDAQLDLTKAPAKTMSGVCDIIVRWKGDPSSGPFYFHLRDLAVHQAQFNGETVIATEVGAPDMADYHYEITPPSSVATGDTSVIRISYSGTMKDEYGSGFWGGVSSSSNVLFAMGVGFYNNYVSTTQHWLPCYDHPSDKATFHGRFTVRDGMTVASNGLKMVERIDDSTVVFDWTHNYQCATYLLTFAVAPYKELTVVNSPVSMELYAVAADTAATRESFRLLPRMVNTYAFRFGDYPFEKVGYVNTPIGAMEHQTMISFPTSLSRSRDTVNETGAHELAHQWFGNYVSPQDFRHAWLNESFATFCESMWQEELGGYEGYIMSQESKMKDYLNNVAKRENLLPLYNFPRANPSSNYPATIYQKGAVVVGMLRYEMREERFFPAIRDYLSRHAYSTATTEGLLAVLNEHARRPLDWFFNQWVYGKGWPILEFDIDKRQMGNGYVADVHVRQIQNEDEYGSYTNIAIEFGFVPPNGDTPAFRISELTEKEQTFTIDLPTDFDSVTVNQGPFIRTLLEVNAIRINNLTSVQAFTSDSGAIMFIVRPNPNDGTAAFTVEVTGTTDCGTVQYELYDTAGHRLLLGTSESCEFSIPTRNFSSGPYILRFKMNGTFYDVSVIIRR